jgi:hypothetical protein
MAGEINLDLTGLKDLFTGVAQVGTGVAGLASGGGAGALSGAVFSNLTRLGTVAGAAVVGIGALGAAAKETATILTEFQRLRDTLGGSGQDTAALRLLGGTLGLGNIGGLAAGLHQASISGGLGTATAMRYGLPIRPVEIGTATDRAGLLMSGLEGLRKTFKSEGMGPALADARNLGLENAIGVVHLLDEQFARIKEKAMLTAQAYGPEQIAQAYELQFATAQLNLAWEKMVVTIGTAVMPAITGITQFFEGIAGLAGGGAHPSQHALQSSMQDLTHAIDRNTSMLRQMPGMVGGGPNAKNALPMAYSPNNGQFISEGLRAGTLKLSPWAFNH